jgi:hypothetical protein
MHFRWERSRLGTALQATAFWPALGIGKAGLPTVGSVDAMHHR